MGAPTLDRAPCRVECHLQQRCVAAVGRRAEDGTSLSGLYGTLHDLGDRATRVGDHGYVRVVSDTPQ